MYNLSQRVHMALLYSQYKEEMSMNYRILIAEDEPRLLEVLCDYFVSRGDVPTPVSNGSDALTQAENGEFDGVLLDIMMPELAAFPYAAACAENPMCPLSF